MENLLKWLTPVNTLLIGVLLFMALAGMRADDSTGAISRAPNVDAQFKSIETTGGDMASSTFAGTELDYGGLDTFATTTPFRTASTTHFALQNPWSGATSSVYTLGIDVTTGASTSRQFFAATSTSEYIGTSGFNCSQAAPITCEGALLNGASLATSSIGSLIAGNGLSYSHGFERVVLSAPIILAPGEWLLVWSTTTDPFSESKVSDTGHSSLQRNGGAGGDGVLDGTLAGNVFLKAEKW